MDAPASQRPLRPSVAGACLVASLTRRRSALDGATSFRECTAASFVGTLGSDLYRYCASVTKSSRARTCDRLLLAGIVEAGKSRRRRSVDTPSPSRLDCLLVCAALDNDWHP